MIHISEGVTLVPHFRLNNKYDGSTILLASSSVFLRFALGFSFLSAVADRFGLWGAFGEPHVAWGTFARFVAYTGKLNWFLPKSGGSDPSHCRDLRRDASWYSAGAGMADAENSSLKWSFASAICSHDDRSSGDQVTFGRLSLLGSRRGLSFGQLRRISIQHRSAATIFA